MLGMGSAHPVDGQDNLGRVVVEVGDGLMDNGAHDALIEARVGRRRRPDGLQILRQLGERERRDVGPSRGRRVMLADAPGDLGHPGGSYPVLTGHRA